LDTQRNDHTTSWDTCQAEVCARRHAPAPSPAGGRPVSVKRERGSSINENEKRDPASELLVTRPPT